VEAHGEKIWVENNSNNKDDNDIASRNRIRGATFYFSLPVMDIQEANQQKQNKTLISNREGR
jgi:signal transduction histidine kinase